MAYVQGLPKELRELLREFAISGTIPLDLPPAIQDKLVRYLDYRGILALREIAPEILARQPPDVWMQKIDEIIGHYDAYDEDLASYLLLALAVEAGIRIKNKMDSGDVVWDVFLSAKQTGDFRLFDRMWDINPEKVFASIGANRDALRYIADKHPQYRVPILLMLIAKGDNVPETFVSTNDLKRWMRMACTSTNNPTQAARVLFGS